MTDYIARNDEDQANLFIDGPLAVEPVQAESLNWKEHAVTPESRTGNASIIEERVETPTNLSQTFESPPERISTDEAITTVPAEAAEVESLTWLKSGEIDEFRSRWNGIQIEFVNDPHTSVEQADALVAEVLGRIAQVFNDKRAKQGEQWINQEDISTEHLRFALQGYRVFFNRLLAQ